MSEITTLTPAEFMLTRDSSNPDVEIYHQIVDAILDTLTQLCNEVEDPTEFREGVIDILIAFDTQPTEH
jgi:hypothetical protein